MISSKHRYDGLGRGIRLEFIVCFQDSENFHAVAALLAEFPIYYNATSCFYAAARGINNFTFVAYFNSPFESNKSGVFPQHSW
jgi:hypothetical protein